VPATLVFYQSPKRVAAMLRDATEVLGADRPAALCREITKKFEEVRRGTVADVAAGCADATPKGEIVVVVGRGDSGDVNEIDLDTSLREALQSGSVRDASDQVAARLRLPRRKVYQRALALAEERRGGEE